MSLIRKLHEAEADRKAAEAKIKEMEEDIIAFSTAFKEFWIMLGVDDAGADVKEAASTKTIIKTLGKLSTKLMMGKLKIDDFAKKWEGIEPIYKKYQHLINTEK